MEAIMLNITLTVTPTKESNVVNLPYVGELIVSKYVTESIYSWLQEVSATKAFVSCVQNHNITICSLVC